MFVVSCSDLSGPGLLSGGKAKRESLPNFVLILADDLGYGDVTSYQSGVAEVETPNIDEVAASGVRFRRYFSGSSICSPARPALLTGRAPAESNFRQVALHASGVGISPEFLTLPELLRQSTGTA